ncbi:MAG TPA: hypothetical protein VGN23_10275 [Verrucomicrobiae bacterium]
MKLRAFNNQDKAMTRADVLAVIVLVIVLLILVIMPMLAAHKAHSPRTACVNNLKEVYLGSLIWADDHNGKFPFEISVANGGTREFAEGGDVLKTFQVMSNELATPKILYCPSDADHIWAANFSSDFSAKNVSYFLGIDADTNSPQSLFAGDDNFQINGVSVKPGLLKVPANAPIGWTVARHKYNGNIGFGDGSVQEATSPQLAANFTNTITRLAIP